MKIIKTKACVKARKKIAIALWKKKLTTDEIAEYIGCTPTTIRLYLRQEKPPGWMPKHRKYSHELEQKIIDLYSAGGKTISEVAHYFNTPYKITYNILFKSGCDTTQKQGLGSHNWKGGKTTNNGYIYVAIFDDDPMYCMAKKINSHTATKYIAEHRLVMARHMNRPLSRLETVHHINGVKTDNWIENLQLRIGNHGTGQQFCCADCGSQNIVPLPLS